MSNHFPFQSRPLVPAQHNDVLEPHYLRMFGSLLWKHVRLAWKHWRFASLAISTLVFSLALQTVSSKLQDHVQTQTQTVIGSIGSSESSWMKQLIFDNLTGAIGVQQFVMVSLVPLCVCLTQVLTLQGLAAEMVTDKETKMKAMQLVNGVPSWLYWLSYATYYAIVCIVLGLIWTAVLMATCFKAPPLCDWVGDAAGPDATGICLNIVSSYVSTTNWLSIFLALELGFIQMFAVSMAITTIFGRARSAASACALCAFLGVAQPLIVSLTFMGFVKFPTVAFYVLGILPTCNMGNLMQAVVLLQSFHPQAANSEGGNEICAILSLFGSTNHYACNIGLPTGWNWSNFFALNQYHFALNMWIDQQQTSEIILLPSAGSSFIALLLNDILIMLFVYWFDQTYKDEFGAARPICFCLRRRPASERAVPLARSRHELGMEHELPCLDIKNLVKEYSRGAARFRAVDNLSLDIATGQLFALLGHNGAGKSTVINCIIGMTQVTSGDILVLGRSVVTDVVAARRYLAICPQDNPLYENITVDAHLRLFAALRGVRNADAEIADVLCALGLEFKRSDRCKSLSGGQKRRLWVATCLLGKAPVAFLDEPTSGMDPASRRELWDLLVAMKSQGRTIIFTTHYLEEADFLADRKAIISKGCIKAIGTSRELKLRFGIGYHLRVLVPRAARQHAARVVGELIVRLLPEAHEESVSEVERAQAEGAPETLAYTLPYSRVNAFGPLLTELEARSEEISMMSYEIAMTSLEEIFMMMGRDDHSMISLPRQTSNTWHRQRVSWITYMLCVIWLRFREVVAHRVSLWRSLVLPIGLTFLAFWLLAGASFHDGKAMYGLGGLFPGLCVGIAVVGMTVAIVQERTTKCKHVMISQGMPSSAYWLGTLTEHYLHLLIVSLCIPGFSLLTDQGYITTRAFDCRPESPFHRPFHCSSSLAPFWVVVIAAVAFPVPVLCCAYHCSYLFRNPEGAMRTLMLLNVLAGGAPAMMVNILLLESSPVPVSGHRSLSSTQQQGLTMHMILSFISPYYALPGSMIGVWWLCSDWNPDPTCPTEIFFFLSAWPVYLPFLGALFVVVVLGLGLLLCDKCSFSMVSALADVDTDAEAISVGDTDVSAEEARTLACSPSEEACLYRGLHHTYMDGLRRVHAVRGISLGIRVGECFGLLGPNGAGKTTTLSCLTGEIRPPTRGEIFMRGMSVSGSGFSDFSEAYKFMGLCPQVDPLIPQLSGRDHLLFFGRMKGVPRRNLHAEVKDVLDRLGFSPADSAKATEHYSGGMKRKLSLAIALIGHSDIMFLDEPSAAVDAGAKRHLWSVIKNRRPNQTVVVTTHSMEEAEALCDRLAIQVQGQLRCIGTPMQIKTKYGSGYQLDMSVRRGPVSCNSSCSDSLHAVSRNNITCTGQELGRLQDFVHSQLSAQSKLLEANNRRYVFQLPPLRNSRLTLGQIFTRMQHASEQLGVEEYSLTQPTLEQVFIRFAKEQREQADFSSALATSTGSFQRVESGCSYGSLALGRDTAQLPPYEFYLQENIDGEPVTRRDRDGKFVITMVSETVNLYKEKDIHGPAEMYLLPGMSVVAHDEQDGWLRICMQDGSEELEEQLPSFRTDAQWRAIRSISGLAIGDIVAFRDVHHVNGRFGIANINGAPIPVELVRSEAAPSWLQELRAGETV